MIKLNSSQSPYCSNVYVLPFKSTIFYNGCSIFEVTAGRWEQDDEKEVEEKPSKNWMV